MPATVRSVRAREGFFRGLATLASLLLVTWNCVAWELFVEVPGNPLQGTETELSRQETYAAEETDFWATEVEFVRRREATARALAGPTPTRRTWAPRITGIDFPARIPGNKSQIIGEVDFEDYDGDVNRLTITVVKAENFEGADYDPRPHLDHGNYTNGAYKIYIWCEGVQDVTLRVTLYDRAGNRSSSQDFSFSCY
jgi:hypothetical protein